MKSDLTTSYNPSPNPGGHRIPQIPTHLSSMKSDRRSLSDSTPWFYSKGYLKQKYFPVIHSSVILTLIQCTVLSNSTSFKYVTDLIVFSFHVD